MKKNLLFFVMTMCCGMAMAQTNAAYNDYIARWYDEAIAQQVEYGIPACITLAQGLLESSAGQSELAREANNHFGIKCTSDWTGDTYRHDDETKNECFRSYKNASESYHDHSLFLRRKRYDPLFELDVTDYKGWANGLKACGYATDPQYPAKLIRIIEDYGLAEPIEAPEEEVSEPVTTPAVTVPVVVEQQQSPIQVIQNDPEAPYVEPKTAKEEKDEFFSKHLKLRYNGVRYVLAQEGDTYATVAFSLNMKERTLRTYNDALDRTLEPGDRIYLTKKKKKGVKEHLLLWVHPGESLWLIAQREGVQLDKILEYNGLSKDIRVFKTRQTIWLSKQPKEK